MEIVNGGVRVRSSSPAALIQVADATTPRRHSGDMRARGEDEGVDAAA